MEFIVLHWPLLAGVALLALLVTLIAVNHKARALAAQAVSAAYKVGLTLAGQAGVEALEWLATEDGAQFRRQLAIRAYDALPVRVGPVPVGLLKLWVSERQFVQMVDAAFLEMREVADSLMAETEVVETVVEVEPAKEDN